MLQKENQNQSTLDVNEVRRGRAIAIEAEAAATEQNCSTTEALIRESSATKKKCECPVNYRRFVCFTEVTAEQLLCD